MNEKNELNDIILNRGNSASSNKKIVLAVATLGVILIIVVMLMSTLTPDAKENLPQPIPAPQEKISTTQEAKEEPLFEEVEVVQEQSDDTLNQITQRLKQQSKESKEQSRPVEPKKQKAKAAPKAEPKVAKKATKKPEKKSKPESVKIADKGNHFIQVGSFLKQPSKKFLDSIIAKGYKYKIHKVASGSKILNKVLIGPFESQKDAEGALEPIKRDIEAKAFFFKL